MRAGAQMALQGGGSQGFLRSPPSLNSRRPRRRARRRGNPAECRRGSSARARPRPPGTGVGAQFPDLGGARRGCLATGRALGRRPGPDAAVPIPGSARGGCPATGRALRRPWWHVGTTSPADRVCCPRPARVRGPQRATGSPGGAGESPSAAWVCVPGAHVQPRWRGPVRPSLRGRVVGNAE